MQKTLLAHVRDASYRWCFFHQFKRVISWNSNCLKKPYFFSFLFCNIWSDKYWCISPFHWHTAATEGITWFCGVQRLTSTELYDSFVQYQKSMSFQCLWKVQTTEILNELFYQNRSTEFEYDQLKWIKSCRKWQAWKSFVNITRKARVRVISAHSFWAFSFPISILKTWVV